jgi:hypothetical protein
MNIEIGRGSESLDESDRSALGLVDAVVLCPPAIEPEKSADKNLQYGCHHFRIVGQLVAQSEGQGQDPLPCRSMWKHMVDHVGRCFRQPPATAGWANRSAFARQRQEPFLAARLALQAQKAASQNAARQILPQLPFDKLRDDPAALPLARKKGFHVAGDRAIQQRVFRIPWPMVALPAGSQCDTGRIGNRHGPQ